MDAMLPVKPVKRLQEQIHALSTPSIQDALASIRNMRGKPLPAQSSTESLLCSDASAPGQGQSTTRQSVNSTLDSTQGETIATF